MPRRPLHLARAPWAAALLLVFAGAAADAPAQEPAPAVSPAPDLQAEYDALRKEFDAAQSAFFGGYSALATDAERQAYLADPERNPNQRFAPRFRAFAERAGTHPAAAEAWMFLLQTGRDAAEQSAIVARVMKDFLHAPAIVEFAQYLQWAEWTIGRPATVAALRTIRADSQHEEGRRAATLTLGIVQLGGAGAEERAEARALLEEVVHDEPDSPRAASAQGYLFELDHLQVGMVAPEIEGTDSEGRAFRLSDYRGQVVVLDFWGFW